MVSDTRDLLRKLRKYQIRIRKAITSQMQGDFNSVFKGTGLEFDDVRAYQYGDDVRAINWNVSAKGHGTFINTFKESKEQTVFFLLDVSASQNIGAQGSKKIQVGKEICGILALSAAREASQVGLIGYSDEKELFIKPSKGQKHSIKLLDRIFKLKPKSLKTDLKKAIGFTLQMLKRKSIVILVSDFIDEGFDKNLKALAKKHDLVVVHLADKRETQFPNLGIVPLLDQETNKTVWFNTSSRAFKKKMEQTYNQKSNEVEELCRKQNANYLRVQTDEDYIPSIVKLFQVRNKARRSA